MDLHAPDAMGKAAHEAAMLSHLLDFRLLAAASATAGPAIRARELEKALTQWPKLCRAMNRLQEAAPNVSRKAQAADAQMRELLEKQRGNS